MSLSHLKEKNQPRAKSDMNHQNDIPILDFNVDEEVANNQQQQQRRNNNAPPPALQDLRIPCKARKRDDTHTSATAFFIVPSNCAHGTRFRCSHNGCDSIFRFCVYCRKMTCDRNFKKQHYPTRSCWPRPP
jgi:hypothetical protein